LGALASDGLEWTVAIWYRDAFVVHPILNGLLANIPIVHEYTSVRIMVGIKRFDNITVPAPGTNRSMIKTLGHLSSLLVGLQANPKSCQTIRTNDVASATRTNEFLLVSVGQNKMIFHRFEKRKNYSPPERPMEEIPTPGSL
jgi:hypothetical protein